MELHDLQRIVGAGHAREAGDGDAIDGIRARFVAAPGSVEEAGALLALAHRENLAVAPRGGGTRLGWGNPPARLDMIVDTVRLDRVLEHAAGDLVVRAQAGVTLQALQETLRGHGQMLALDPSSQLSVVSSQKERSTADYRQLTTDYSTIGGIIATNASGPRRLRYGTARDLLIGITVVLADGTVAKAGGKVVKNVAGYDLCKLFTGSLGTLGLIVEAIFRLHPRLADPPVPPGATGPALPGGTAGPAQLPADRRMVVAGCAGPEQVGAAVQSILHSPLVPSALELAGPAPTWTLLALFEGIAAGVEAQAGTALELLRPHADARVAGADEEQALWRRVATPWQDGDVGLKVSAVPAALPTVLRDVAELARRFDVQTGITGHAGSGITYVGLSGGDDAAYQAIIAELRWRAGHGGGSVVVLQAPPTLKRTVDVWGPMGDALPLMRRVKERFDPQGIMNPGRFVGEL